MWDETLGGYFVLWWREVKVWSVISHTSRNAPLEGVGNPPAIPREYSAVQGERNCSLLTGNYREACVPKLTDPGIGIFIGCSEVFQEEFSYYTGERKPCQAKNARVP